MHVITNIDKKMEQAMMTCREWQIIGLPVFHYLPMYFLVKFFFPPDFCCFVFQGEGNKAYERERERNKA